MELISLKKGYKNLNVNINCNLDKDANEDTDAEVITTILPLLHSSKLNFVIKKLYCTTNFMDLTWMQT